MTKRVGLVGCGSMGANHARVIATGVHSKLEVVIDPNEQVGQAMANRYGARWAPDLDQLGDVDAAVVAAPTDTHHALVLDLIGRSVPTLVEKPLCPSLTQCTELIEAAHVAATPLMCGLLERFNSAVILALAMAEQPVHVRTERHSPYAPRVRSGVGWDLLIHDIDLVVRAFEEPPTQSLVASGTFHPNSLPLAEDVAEVIMTFPENRIAAVSASRLGQRKSREMTICELDKVIEVDLLRRGVTVYRHTTIEESEIGHAGFRQRTEIEVPEVVGSEPLVAQFDHFLRLIRGEVDAEAELASILPSHQVVEDLLRARGV